MFPPAGAEPEPTPTPTPTPTPAPTPADPTTTESLFFSEVAEGGANKWVAIYNPTDDEVALGDIRVQLMRQNGQLVDKNLLEMTSRGDGELVSLAANSQIVICSPQALRSKNARGVLQDADCDIEDSSVISYNGDDGLNLFVQNELVDVFGEANADEKNVDAFTVCGTNTTEDVVLIRKQNVCGGNTEELKSFGTTNDDCEWIVRGAGNVDDVKFHVALCGKPLSLLDKNC